MSKVAIVILNWNGRKLLEKFLGNVLKHSKADGVEVIVADNASSDDSVSFLQHTFPNVKKLVFNQNYGFAGGYNKAIESVDAEYTVLLNSDVEVTKGWLDPLLRFMDDNENVAACAPKLLDYKNQNYFEYAGGAGGYIDRYGYPFCRGRIFQELEEDKKQYEDTVDVLWATGACLMVRTSCYRKLGGLDQNFFAHQEEVDLCWRMKREGYRVVCIPQSSVYHVGGASLSVGSPKKTYLNFRNSLLLLYKNQLYRSFGKTYRVRLLLDVVAGIKFLLSDGPGHFLAVLRAHVHFHKIKSKYRVSRKQLKERVGEVLPEVMPNSLVWLHFVKKKKYFSELFDTGENKWQK